MTLIVEPVPNTSSVVGVILVIPSPVPLALTAVPLAEVLKYFVVIIPFPVATVTSTEFPEAIVIVRAVTLNVDPFPITSSVSGVYPVTALKVSPTDTSVTTFVPLPVVVTLHVATVVEELSLIGTVTSLKLSVAVSKELHYINFFLVNLLFFFFFFY